MPSTNKITRKDIEISINRLKLLKFFPGDPGPAAAAGEFLAKICPHVEALEWLVATLMDRIGSWPGTAEVRGILCNKYDAADGIDGWSTLPGFRDCDNEAKYLEETHERLKEGSWHPNELVQQLADARDMKQITGRKLN